MNEFALYRSIGASVRLARKAAGLTQDELADRIGLFRTSIANLEAGRQRSPIHVIYAIAEVLSVPAHQFLPRIEEIGAVVIVTIGEQTHILTRAEAEALRNQLERDDGIA